MGHDLNDRELKATRDSNGANICVGDYVRTDKGNIGKVKEIRLGMNKSTNNFIDVYMLDTNLWTTKEYIVKHSKNIKGLIEVGDYVNGYEVLDKYLFNGKLPVLETTGEETNCKCLSNGDIKSIVTKEQFNSIAYRLEE